MTPAEPIAAQPVFSQGDGRPSLWKDPAYHGMNLTQFLGAFNDNLFKQLVLLICVDSASRGQGDYQMYAQALFALPFVLFSGFAGFLADRLSKRRIVVSMKVLEIGIMSAGVAAFHAAGIPLHWLLLLVFFMGTHSAFFGPSKYGILPELFRESDLPQVNGMIQMTTFLAIIFGVAAAGFTKEWFGDRLWMGSVACVAIAVFGTATSLLVRKTPVANPSLRFTGSALFLAGDTWRMIRNDRPLFGVLLVSSLFWFLGGVVQPSANALGKLQLHYGDGRTSVMIVCMAVGIMIGCLWGGSASHGRIRFDFVTRGAWGIVLCLGGVSLLGSFAGTTVPKATAKQVDSASIEDAAASTATLPEGAASPDGGAETETFGRKSPESLAAMIVPRDGHEWIVRALLCGVGLSAGFFVVPLAVFLQVRPPESQKGRMIGAMNLVNWIGIMVASVFQGVTEHAFIAAGMRISWIFAVCALVMLPIALFYRPAALALD